MKPKICIVADVPNWSFDSIAQKLKKELEYKYEIKIVYFNRRTEAEFFYEFLEENDDCDWMHFLNRRILLLMNSPVFQKKVKKNGRKLKEYIEEKKKKFSTAIYDYLDLSEEELVEEIPIFNNYTSKYYTCTRKLFQIYSSLANIKKPDAMIHDICDEKKFIPLHLERFQYQKIKNREIIVGWVGNSVHKDEKDVDLKGYRSILLPVMEELQKEGYQIRGYYADRNDNWKLSEEMPDYYSQIDVCICVSTCEGTPRPVLEAMYSGVPIISTDVGIVEEAFGKQQKQFIIENRENGKKDELVRKKLKEKLIYLYQHRELFQILSQENQKSIQLFDGGKTIQAFDSFFEKCLETLHQPSE